MTTSCPACGTKNRLLPEKLDRAARCGKCQQPIAPLDRPHPFASAEELDAVVAASPLPVVIDFWAGWCGPCVMVGPEVERLAKERAGQVLVGKVDTEALPQLAQRYGIRGIPAFILFRDGKPAANATGAMPAEGIARSLGL